MIKQVQMYLFGKKNKFRRENQWSDQCKNM
jgi:hypothetical protein